MIFKELFNLVIWFSFNFRFFVNFINVGSLYLLGMGKIDWIWI